MADTAVTSPADTAVFTPGRRALTAGLVMTVTLVGFEGLAVATVMPVVRADLGGIALYGWVFSGFFLGSIVGIVAAGRAADRSGPVRPFVAGLVLFATGLLGAGLAPSMVVLVGARIVQGVGAGAIPAVAYAAIGRAYPVSAQPRMFAVLSSAWVLPGVIGPALAGAVADTFGWRWVFLGLLPLVVIAGSIATPALRALGAPGGAEPEDRRVDATVLALGAGAILAGATAHSLLVAVPLVVVGAFVGWSAFVRLMPPGTLRLADGLPAAVAIRGIITFAFFGTDAFVTLALTSEHGASATVAGLALTAATLTWTAGAWVQERRVQHVGPRTFVRIGAFVIAAGIALMVSVALTSAPIAVGVVAWAIAGLGMGLAYAPCSLVVLSQAPAGREGTAAASLQLSETLGVALGTGVSGAIVAAAGTLGTTTGGALAVAFGVGIVFAIAGALAAARLPSHVATH